MNLNEWAKKMNMEMEDLLELVDLFLKTTSSELAELQSALKHNDFRAAETLAHSIKGAAGAYGLLEIHEAAKKIEAVVHNNRLDEMNGNVQTIREELELITEIVKWGNRNAQN